MQHAARGKKNGFAFLDISGFRSTSPTRPVGSAFGKIAPKGGRPSEGLVRRLQVQRGFAMLSRSVFQPREALQPSEEGFLVGFLVGFGFLVVFFLGFLGGVRGWEPSVSAAKSVRFLAGDQNPDSLQSHDLFADAIFGPFQ